MWSSGPKSEPGVHEGLATGRQRLTQKHKATKTQGAPPATEQPWERNAHDPGPELLQYSLSGR